MNTARHTTGNGQGFSASDLVAGRVRQVRVWALAQGLVADAAAVELICRVKATRPGSFDHWTMIDVDEMLWHQIVDWCGQEEVAVPPHTAETLWTYLGFVHDTGVADLSSQSVSVLRAPLIAYGGLGADGRPRPVAPRRRVPARPLSQPQPQPQPQRKADHRPGDLAPIIPLRPRRERPSSARHMSRPLSGPLVPSTPS